ncbi:MAG TPA: acyl-CoA dehydrogenase family protein [Burkholderiaceae bacterium]|nr:acyl-CoA dehydrogenase family protein [Burkholderiaceae bacterium]
MTTQMQLVATTSQYELPFFDAVHAQLASRLVDWLPQQQFDESDDRRACKEWVKRLGQGGWLRYCVPAGFEGELGGALPQLDSRALVILRETLAFHSPLADFTFAMQGLGSGAITLAGTAQQQAHYLPAVARGDKIAAFALSEPDAGSDVAAMQTSATKAYTQTAINNIAHQAINKPATGQFDAKNDGNHEAYSLSGVKTWISNGGIADFYVTFAKTDVTVGTKGISAFIVDADVHGLDTSEHIQVMAPHPLATLRFANCRVPSNALLGVEGEGFKLAMRTLDIFRASVAAAAIGMARRAMAEALRFAGARRMFGGTLADMQLTQAKFGSMAALIDGAALLTYRAAWMRDTVGTEGKESAAHYSRASAMAKLVATENAQQVIDMALQMHGGQGVQVGNVLEHLYRDIRSLRIYEGATEVQQLIIGKSVLKTAINSVA